MWDLFIKPPYWKCPQCLSESFGVSSINSNSYTRTCKNCEYTDSYKLPALKKKIIYLDQFAISKMMFALNPNTGKQEKIDGIWTSLFCKLHELCKLNLIICPDSSYHRHESYVSQWFESLKRLYELLSGNVQFKTDVEIKQEQIYTHAKAWVEKSVPDLNINEAVRGDVSGWLQRLQIAVHWKASEAAIEQLREDRGQISEILNTFFRKWHDEKGKDIADWYQEEVSSYGNEALRQYSEHFYRVKHAFRTGNIDIAVTTLKAPSSFVEIVTSAINAFRDSGVPDVDIPQYIFDFFQDQAAIKKIPFVNTTAWLFAALARSAANGQKTINQGTANDIDSIATLSPYCDAMLVDNPSRELIRQVSKNLGLNCTFFSENELDVFISYLDAIKAGADADLLTKVREVYGDSWKEPYTALFANDD